MSFFILETIHRAIAPQHKIGCSALLWWRLVRSLRQRGNAGTRESGAFLLGTFENGRRRITDFVLYDDLDPLCLDTGIVRFDGRFFSDLWKICKQSGLSVVGDIHVHPAGCGQSASDKNHPMISTKGHIAMILPNFAKGRQKRSKIGIYVYRGDKKWANISDRDRSKFFSIGL